eukprot:TRINITY_DN4835_c1_g1_i7.p1 TRINITY_DN4835_c1_g1~~TRINITY_DN4835_c1_g1_i7.p1  ORF type:complete len:126 (-),score=8.09 TRINITY_DN4835_c1_g1_i7:149-526(-)
MLLLCSFTFFYYALSPKLPDSLTEVQIAEIVCHNKCTFFIQQPIYPCCCPLKEHDKVWNFTMEVLRGPADKFEHTEQRIKNSYGTVLFIDDLSPEEIPIISRQIPRLVTTYKCYEPICYLDCSRG